MPFVTINNYSTTLASGITSTATSLTVSSATGLPTLGTGELLPLTLNSASNGTLYEIVYVSAISGTTLTIERAQEGTTALAWNAGDYIACFPTAGTVEKKYGDNSYSVLAGTTAGNIDWSQPLRGFAKKFVANFVGYENDTTTNQTITFPTPFLVAPSTLVNTTGLTISASTTTLTITAPNSTTVYNGIIILEGV